MGQATVRLNPIVHCEATPEHEHCSTGVVHAPGSGERYPATGQVRSVKCTEGPTGPADPSSLVGQDIVDDL